MKYFRYVVTNGQGKKERGKILATSEEEAIQKLKRDGKWVVGLVEQKKASQSIIDRPSLSFESKLMFTKHLATMIDAGINLTEAFNILIEQTPRGANKKMFENIFKMISAGETLSMSLRQYPRIFSEIFVNMVSIGEKSGSLSETLQYLDEQMEKEYELRKKVVGAFIYPAVIVVITLLLTLGIVVFIMPKISKIFTSFDVALPLPTRILIASSDLLTTHPLKVIGVTILTVVIISQLFRIRKLGVLWRRIWLFMPVFGKILISMNLARFSRTMNSLLKAGVPITQALDITSKVFTDPSYQKIIDEARRKVEQGSTVYEALQDQGRLFPTLAIKMLNVGEKTGQLEKTTGHLAKLYEHQVD
ncbi:MAG: type II secretion system F family protein, partial [Patescibacteria group bacterium]